MKPQYLRSSAAVLFVALGLAAGAGRLEPTGSAEKIYDEKADALKDVAAAEKIATAENSRVLLMIGGNWCGWCHKLHGLMKSNAEVAAALRGEYQVVNVDIGQGDRNQELLKKYDIKPEGYPYLAVIDPISDKLVTQQETGALEEGDHHDPAKVVSFLKKNQAPAEDADKLLASSLETARVEGKQVFLRFGAPWCGWCHKLDDVLRQPEVAEALSADLIVLKIDVDRMTAGKDVQKKYQTSGGIPWFAVLSPDGKVTGTSELTPGQNVGFPTEPAEIDHVVKILTAGKKNITDAQIATLRKALTDAATKVKAAGH